MEPIRVLHILHSMNRGGAENAIMNYYRFIDRSKVQFDFLLTDTNKCQFEDEIKHLGGRLFRVPLLTICNPFPYVKGVYRFLKSHQEYRIVHSHTSSKSFLPLWIAKKCSVTIRICHSHASQSESGSRGMIRDLLKPFLKVVATHCFSCGYDAALWLYGEKMVKRGRVQFFPNVIDASKFDYDKNVRHSIRTLLGISGSTVVLGCTARFSKVKNHYFLISLFEQFHNRIKDSRLLLVGDGELRYAITQRVESLGLKDSVIFTGVVQNVPDYEQAMDFFLLPSFNEGIPLSLIEAQVSGLHCYASTGVPCESDKTGLVSFLPIDKGVEPWLEVIINDMRYQRSSRLEDIVAAGYDAKTSARKLESFYREMYTGFEQRR